MTRRDRFGEATIGHTWRRRGATSASSRLGITFIAAMMALTTLGVGTALAATAANGNFEDGTLTGWTAVSAGSGGWFNYTGTSAPVSGMTIPAPPEGTRAAVADQTGPGSHVLYQDLVLESTQSHSLSFFVYYDNRASSFETPDTLSHTSVANQQYRIDIMKPTADVSSVVASDVLATIFRTAVGDPLTLAPTLTTFELTPWAGSTVRLRFAAVDNMGNFQSGVDAVAVTSTLLDQDGDGVPDANDAFPTNPGETIDTDGDGTGNNADGDDDGDGVADDDDAFPLDSQEHADTDGDGTGDNADTDDDNDGVADGDDAFPTNGDETTDTDGDGIGNNADGDDDNDGVADGDDAFPLDRSKSTHTGDDGTGNNADTGDDGDGGNDTDDIDEAPYAVEETDPSDQHPPVVAAWESDDDGEVVPAAAELPATGLESWVTLFAALGCFAVGGTLLRRTRRHGA